MNKKDIYSSLSELMSELLNLKNIQNKSTKKESNENKYFEIYEKFLSLKANNEKEIELKKNCKIFIDKILEKELNKIAQFKEINSKNNFGTHNEYLNDIKENNQNKDKNYQKNNKIYSEINKFISTNVHIHLYQNLEEIYQKNDSNKISEIKAYLNDAYNKLKSINDEITDIILDELYFSKYFTLLYSIYPFFSKKQKESILNWSFSKEIKNI